MWQDLRRNYRQYLQLERGLSRHSIEAYLRDLDKLHRYVEVHYGGMAVTQLTPQHLRQYVQFLHDLGLSARTQARMTSALRNFFAYLVEEGVMQDNPALEIDLPRLRRHLPEVLSVEEVERIFRAVDLSHPMGHRDRAILETLYACGLRVSELIHLESASVYSEEGYIRVIGKNNKERYIPIAPSALHQIELYRQHVPQPSRSQAQSHCSFSDDQKVRPCGGYQEKCQSSYLSPHLCHPFGRRRCRSPRRPATPRSCLYLDHRNLHPHPTGVLTRNTFALSPLASERCMR